MTDHHCRRAVWPILVLAGLLAGVASGCTPPGLPAPLAPSATPSVSGVAPDGGSVVIGVDGVPAGFNPHAITDYSPAARAVDALVLPSVSRVRPDGTTVLDPALVDSAAVTSTDPFTVTYRLNRASSWSDGTPITAEDFRYLSAALQTEPGTVDAAGYALITSIRGLDGGKTVQVGFSAPFPSWPTLFSPLLPAHIMKDSPGGWSGALAGGIPVSGSRYKMTGYDTTSGQITLTRNDKYWLAQSGPATVVLRIGAPEPLLAALDRADVQAALLGPTGLPPGRLDAAVPATRRKQVTEPGSVQLVFDTRSGPTAQVALRRAVGLGLDDAPIRAALAGGRGDTVRGVGALLDPGEQVGTGPALAQGRPAAALADLIRAGWTRQGAYLRRDGAVLRLLLSYPNGDDDLDAAAREIQRQLGGIGIEVDLQQLDPAALIDSMLAGRTALGLLFVPRGPSEVLAAQSSFGCPTPVLKPEPVTASIRSGQLADPTADTPPPDPDPGTETSPTGSPSAAPTSGAPDAASVQIRTGNLSGFCDPALDADLAAAALGSPGVPGSAAADDAESRLRAALPVLPLGRPTLTFVVSTRLAGVLATVGPGSAFSSPLSQMSDWPRP